MIQNNDLQALSQVSDELTFLVDEDQAFKEVNKTEKKAHQISSEL
jgi:hypothetical protein